MSGNCSGPAGEPPAGPGESTALLYEPHDWKAMSEEALKAASDALIDHGISRRTYRVSWALFAGPPVGAAGQSPPPVLAPDAPGVTFMRFWVYRVADGRREDTPVAAAELRPDLRLIEAQQALRHSQSLCFIHSDAGVPETWHTYGYRIDGTRRKLGVYFCTDAMLRFLCTVYRHPVALARCAAGDARAFQAPRFLEPDEDE